MSLFYNCFRLLFPDEPPSVTEPPDPGGDTCPNCGGGGDDGGCTGPDCNGTDPCDELITLYTCGDCNQQSCCQNRQFETKSIQRWNDENNCNIDCDTPPESGCLVCDGVKYHFEGSCQQCCPSEGCFEFQCLDPNPCTYLESTPFPAGCCEKKVDAYAWVPLGDAPLNCPAPPAGSYLDKVTCDVTEQCFNLVRTDPRDPGSIGGTPGGAGGGAPGAPATCLMYKCNGAIGDCIKGNVNKSAIPGLGANDPCPTTGSFAIQGDIYYANESFCENNAPDCCPRSTYWYCTGSPGQTCQDVELCPYEIDAGSWQGFRVYSSEQGCNDTEDCGETLTLCELFECVNGQCLPVSKTVEQWAVIFGLNTNTVTECAQIKQWVDGISTGYFTTLGRCQAQCGDGGGKTGGGGDAGTSLDEAEGDSLGRIGNFQDDPVKVSEVFRDLINKDALIDPIVNNRNFNTRNIRLALVDNNFRTDIFSNKIHYSVREAITQSRKESYNTPEVVYDDLTYDKIEASLNDNLRERLSKVHTLDGVPLKYQVIKRLKFLIVNGLLGDFDVADLESLVNEKQSITPVTVGYEKRFINFLDTRLKPMHPDRYQGRGKELMRLWKTIAEDVDKSVILVDDDRFRRLHPVKNNDTFEWINASGDVSTLSIQDGDYIKTLDSKGNEIYVPLYTNLDKSFMLDLKETSQAFSMLKSSYEILLDVSSEESSLVEETYDLSNSREVGYYLKLDPNTIEDLPYEKTVIRKTKVVYDLETDERDMNEWSKFKPWPYFTVYIDPEDPFIDHMVDSGKVTVTYKDISFKRFIGHEDEYPNIPRRIPWYLVIIPTDRTSLLVSTGRSELVSFNERRISYNLHPNNSKNKRKFVPGFLMVERADDGEGVNPNDDYVGPIYTVFNKELITRRKKLFKGDDQTLPRRKTNVRKLLESMKALRDSGDSYLDSNNNIISWGTLYKNLKIRERKSLSLFEFADWDRAKGEIENNSFAKEDTTKERYTKVTVVPPTRVTKVDQYNDPDVTPKVIKLDIDPETETPEEL